MELLPNPLVAPFMPTELAYASGLFPLVPAEAPRQTSTPSIRSRRSNGSSSDEAPVPAFDGFIEADLRAGGPRLCELPCKTIYSLPKDYKDFNTLTGPASYHLIIEIGGICRDENIEESEMDFCCRQSIFEPDTDPIITLLIIAKRVPGHSWITLARRIHEHLKTKNLDGISVELIDLRAIQNPNIFPCIPSDAIFPVWETIATEILRTIGLNGIISVNCFRIGHSNDRDRCPPTILLGVNWRQKEDWKRTREEILTVLERHGLSTVGVLIRKDMDSPMAGASIPKPINAAHCTSPKLGFSISPHGSQYGYGTLGAWVELQNPDSKEWVPFAVTCSHCCFPSEERLSPNDIQVLQNWKQQGVPVQDTRASEFLMIDSPTYRDLTMGIRKLDEQIEHIASDPIHCQVEAEKATGNFTYPRAERKRKILGQKIELLTKGRGTMKKFVRNNCYVFGSVFAASGLREVASNDDLQELSIRDWALIKPKNKHSMDKNEFEIPVLSGLTQLNGFSERTIKSDQELFKLGRTTGHTVGRYGGLRAARVSRKVIDGKETELKTWEHAIVAPRDIFVQAGDSGSFVFDTSGYVAGMVFGGSSTGDVGYFTSTKDLLEDIRKITGVREVRLLGEID